MNYNEIEACVIKAKHGDREALLKIIEQFRPFIFKTAHSYNIKSYDTYDLAQAGYIALVNAVSKYKIGSHTFSSYAFNAIKNAFRYAARQNLKCNRDFSLNAPINEADMIDTEFIDCIEGDENVEEDILNLEEIQDLRKALTKLTEEELELIIMVYYGGVSLKLYAEKKNLKYLQVIRRKNMILEKLRGFIK